MENRTSPPNFDRPREALRFLRRALPFARKVENIYGEEVILGNIGVAYADLGNTRLAVKYYEQQLDIAREIGDPGGQATALHNIALEAAKRRQLTKAIDYGNQSLAILEEIEAADAQRTRDKLAEWRQMLKSSEAPTAVS